jgi:hypothetical protein
MGGRGKLRQSARNSTIITSDQRKGRVDPALMKLFPVEDNDQQESYSRMSKYVRSLDPESDPFEETKLSIPDGYTMLPQMKNMDFQNQVQGNMNLPFKVFRP